ncbi:armadillo-type protein [Spinellus fusiger]|nr:armadillo-type protein [Spinellus fusiger]
MAEALETSSSPKDIASILVERASVYEALGQSVAARQDIQAAVEKDATNEKAQAAARLLFPVNITEEKDPRVDLFRTYLERLSPAETGTGTETQMGAADIKVFCSSSDFISVLMACGMQDTPPSVRATAYMVLTRLFHPPQEKDYPMTFIIEQCAKSFSHCLGSGKNKAKLLAFQTLYALFQTSMTVGATILSQDGVVQDCMDVIEFEVVEVQLAMANVLAIASSDKTCQKLIVKYGSGWLAKIASRPSSDERLKAVVGTTLTKLQAQGAETSDPSTAAPEEDKSESLQEAMRHMNISSGDLVESMKAIVKSKSEDATVVLNAVEGLAYSTLESKVKESLVKDAMFMKSLVALAINAANTNSNPLLFGIGTILLNITMYRPVLDEQQQQMKKLRDLANAKNSKTSSTGDDPKESDKAVEVRVQLAVDHGAALALMVLAKSTSQNIRIVAASTYHQLVTPQTTRGTLLQQGIVKALLPLTTSQQDPQCSLMASQSLAKLAITTDPRLAFGSHHPQSLVRPFLSLCKQDNSQLCQFEGLMALTNLASVDDEVRLQIFNEQGMTVFENLQLSNNTMVQRAATEMVCNMTFCDPVFDMYSNAQQPGSQNKVRLLMILSDHEDERTRKAASGALAILANSKGTCEMMTHIDRGYERIARLLEKEEVVDVQHRGVEIVRCMVHHLEKEAVEGLVNEKVDKKLIAIVKECQVAVVRAAAMEVLKLLAGHGAVIRSNQ